MITIHNTIYALYYIHNLQRLKAYISSTSHFLTRRNRQSFFSGQEFLFIRFFFLTFIICDVKLTCLFRQARSSSLPLCVGDKEAILCLHIFVRIYTYASSSLVCSYFPYNHSLESFTPRWNTTEMTQYECKRKYKSFLCVLLRQVVPHGPSPRRPPARASLLRLVKREVQCPRSFRDGLQF